MKAIAVVPGKPNSVHLAELAKPSIDDIPDGRGVLVKVLRVGVDGTDREINAAEYGAAPEGYDFLVIGHESFGQVEAVGPQVTAVQPGDYVVATVRRAGASLYDQIGTSDMTTDDTYFERGINLRHGFLTEYYVDDAEYIVKVPKGLKEVGVLLEPMTVVEKGIAQAYDIQRRLRVWRPRRARAPSGCSQHWHCASAVLRSRPSLSVANPISTPTSSRPSAPAMHRRQTSRSAKARNAMGHSTSFLRRRASRPSSSRACKRSAKTACWCSPA
jgi:hypothetical protein